MRYPNVTYRVAQKLTQFFSYPILTDFQNYFTVRIRRKFVIIKSTSCSFYRAVCNATHGIAVAILSVCPSIRCVYCDKTK